MKEDKLVKLQVNRSSNQCRLSVPQCHWENIPKSGWYKVSENNGVLTYTPTNKPRKAKIPIPPIIAQGNEVEDEIEANPIIPIRADQGVAFNYDQLAAHPHVDALAQPSVWEDDE